MTMREVQKARDRLLRDPTFSTNAKKQNSGSSHIKTPTSRPTGSNKKSRAAAAAVAAAVASSSIKPAVALTSSSAFNLAIAPSNANVPVSAAAMDAIALSNNQELPPHVEESFAKLAANLKRYARANDRRMVLRSLREAKYLGCLALDKGLSQDTNSLEGCEEEITTEHIVLNGIPFRGCRHFLTTFQALCSKLTEQVTNITAEHLYFLMVYRLSRSSASADCYFKLNSLMGSLDLIVMPTEACMATPVYINLYVSNGCVQGTVRSTHGFGLFRKADVKPADLVKGYTGGRPWIGMTAVVDERSNFSTNDIVRTVSVRLPESLY